MHAAWAANDFGQVLRSIRKARLEPLEAEMKRKRIAADAVKKYVCLPVLCCPVLALWRFLSAAFVRTGTVPASSFDHAICLCCSLLRCYFCGYTSG